MAIQLFITGISTNVGKTIVSAILAEAISAHYWKPVQAGDLENSDSMKVAALTSNVTVLQEAFRLTSPQSPHAAAKIDKVELPERIDLPVVENHLIVEGAGGLLVPLNDNGTTIADWAKHWNLPVVIVSMHYLGSINHTLLTIEAMQNRNIAIFGIVFVGEENIETEAIIAQRNVPILGRIPFAETITKSFVAEQAALIQTTIFYG